jgi:GNAT superfamily N-acetyltransferase
MTAPVTVRPAAEADLAAVRAISVATGQEGSASGADLGYLAHVLANGRMLVATGADGELAGWAAVVATPAGELLSDLFVHPDRHGGGVGGAVLRALWPDPDAGGRFTFSSRHENALPLYARAGVLPCWPLLYLTGARARVTAPDLQVHRVDAPTAAAAETVLTGFDRPAEYAFWAAIGTPVVVDRGGRTIGAGVLGADEVVHLATDDKQACEAALAALSSDTVSLCLPGPHPAVARLLRAGFRITDYDLAMVAPDVRLATTWAYSPGLA